MKLSRTIMAMLSGIAIAFFRYLLMLQTIISFGNLRHRLYVAKVNKFMSIVLTMGGHRLVYHMVK